MSSLKVPLIPLSPKPKAPKHLDVVVEGRILVLVLAQEPERVPAGFRFWGLGFRVNGLGFRALGGILAQKAKP